MAKRLAPWATPRALVLSISVLLVLPVAARGQTPAGNPVSEQEARDLIERWRDAQNKGDLAAYSNLYAEAFRGVRRSGKRVAEFDRTGWLGDRERMFKKPMSVEVTDVEVTPGAPTRVQFKQTFRMGKYADVGTKRLELARDPTEPRILREELLESQPPAKPAPPPDRPEALYPVVVGEAKNDEEAKAALAEFDSNNSALAELSLAELHAWWQEGSTAPRRLIIGYCTQTELDERKEFYSLFFPRLRAGPATTRQIGEKERCPADPNDNGSHAHKPLTVDTPGGTLTAISYTTFVCCDCLFEHEAYRWTVVFGRNKRGAIVDHFSVADTMTNGTWEAFRNCDSQFTENIEPPGIDVHQYCYVRRGIRPEKVTSDFTWTARLDGKKMQVKKRRTNDAPKTP